MGRGRFLRRKRTGKVLVVALYSRLFQEFTGIHSRAARESAGVIVAAGAACPAESTTEAGLARRVRIRIATAQSGK